MNDLDRRRDMILEKISELHALSRKGLWGLALFVAISTLAAYFRNFNLMAAVSPEVRDFLGKPPSSEMISIALVVYSFSALILILARMSADKETYRGWAHLGYLSGFYIFYFVSHALHENFWAVFAAGLTILGLEYYNVWSYSVDAIKKEKELLTQLEKKSPPSMS